MTTTSQRNGRRTNAAPATFQSPAIRETGKRVSRAVKPAPPALVEQSDEHPRPTHHNGVAIVSEERIAIGANGSGKLKTSRLYLADGQTAHACWDCLFTAERRGDVLSHRNAVHGTSLGGHRRVPKVTYQKDPDLLDLVLPTREDGTHPGDNPLYWQIGEFLAVLPTVKALGDHMDELERENEALREQLKETRVSKSDQHKIDVYPSNQVEIGELRAWKKKMIQKLSALGFTMSEED